MRTLYLPKLFAIVLFSGCFLCTLGQPPTLRWAHDYADTAAAYAGITRMDSDRNTITLGAFTGTMDLDPGLGTMQATSVGGVGGFNLFVQKLDSSGQFVFGGILEGCASNQVRNLAIGPANEILISGHFSGTVDFDPGPGTYLLSAPLNKGFVCLLHPSGSLDTVFVLEGASTGIWPLATWDGTGNILVAGYFANTIDADPGPGTWTLSPAGGYTDIFLIKWSRSGVVRWARTWGGTEFDYTLPPVSHSDGSITMAGKSGSMDLDPGPGSFPMVAIGGRDMYVIRVDSNGVFVKGGRMGGSGALEGIACIRKDPYDNVYLAGNFDTPGDFDPGPGTYTLIPGPTNNNHYIVKLNPTLDFLNAKCLPDMYIASVAVDSAQRIHVAALVDSTFDIDPGPATVTVTSAGWWDVVIATYDPQLDYLGHFQVGGPDAEQLGDIDVSFPGTITICGSFKDTVDFDPGASTHLLSHSPASEDGFIAQYQVCQPVFQDVSLSGCDSVVYGMQAFPLSGTYCLYQPTACDTVIRIAAQVGHTTVTQLNVTACEPYTLNGITYTATGNYTQTLTSAQGCDSTLELQFALAPQPNLQVQASMNVLTSMQPGATYQWIACDSGYQPIPGATGRSYTALISGNYAVIVGLGSCMDTSACVFVNVTGVDVASGVCRLFPNPSTGSFTVAWGHREPAVTVTVWNAIGQRLMVHEAWDQEQVQLDVPGAGVYGVEVQLGGKRQWIPLMRK